MVLAELGQQISGALRGLQSATIVDEAVVAECVKTVCRALLQSDVQLRLVQQFKIKVTQQINAQLLQHSSSSSSSSGSSSSSSSGGGGGGGRKKGAAAAAAAAAATKGFDAASGAAAPAAAAAAAAAEGDVMAEVYTEADPVKIAEEGVRQFKADKYDLVVVDTSGRHRQEAALFEEMQQVAEAINPDDIVFVLDSHIGQACFEQAKAFHQAVEIGSVIVTKLDGHARGGGALSAVAATGAPIIFLGSGEHFDDFDPFDANSFVSRLLGLGDMGGLMNSLKEVISAEKQQEMIERISKGKFTLQDMYDQFQNVLKMGPLSKVMSMIPGLGSNLLPKGEERLATLRIKRLTCAMDSMTKAELACEKPFTDSRIMRVAQGSGTSVEEVRLILEQHKQ
ncbi:signal recognition particle 54 kDa protein, putative [Eimeria brunetti]|uniref:signal-recognition-particle GTPase n=1 Tax=Eimeria brunetti TaxID=51314 RepID=U6LTF0_9EIME|nr:signal recognition particle 54 kDa protein, putative [Eimeria brunetti]